MQIQYRQKPWLAKPLVNFIKTSQNQNNERTVPSYHCTPAPRVHHAAAHAATDAVDLIAYLIKHLGILCLEAHIEIKKQPATNYTC